MTNQKPARIEGPDSWGDYYVEYGTYHGFQTLGSWTADTWSADRADAERILAIADEITAAVGPDRSIRVAVEFNDDGSVTLTDYDFGNPL